MIGTLHLTASAQEEALFWPTGSNQGQIQMMKIETRTSGPVEKTRRGFENWGEASSVTWQYANNFAGEYNATLTYESSEEVRYTLSIRDVTHEPELRSWGLKSRF